MLQRRDSMGKAARYWLLRASVISNKRMSNDSFCDYIMRGNIGDGRDKTLIAKHFRQREYTRKIGNECGGG